jgi:excisionase family DNA binding protein
MSQTDAKTERASNTRLLKIDDVAEMCSISKRTVYRWIDSEGLPVHRFPGSGRASILRIANDDLADWLGQYRHDFAEENKPEQIVKLNGRRFIGVGRSSSVGKDGPDRGPRWRPSAAMNKEGTEL